MRGAGVLAALVTATLAGALGVPHAASADPVVLEPPVDGRVIARFHQPTTYGAGHRGVDLDAPPGTEVRAPAAGTVTFSGVVVGRRWVTVDHGEVRSTVGPLRTATVVRGDHVVRGEVVGISDLAHGRRAVHWSVRRGDTYLDPLAFGPRVATLLPDADAATPSAAASGPATRRGVQRDAVPRQRLR